MSAQDKSARFNAFKNHGKDMQEMRRRRHDVTIELRKNKKNEQLQKKRNIADTTSPLQEHNSSTHHIALTVDEIILGMASSDPQERLAATQAARKNLSRERNPPIDSMINLGIVPNCVQFLSDFEHPELQFEAAWALTNIASGTAEQTRAVIKAGAVPHLVDLVYSPYENVSEQAVWALGNIAGDGPNSRDLVLGFDAMSALLKHASDNNTTVNFLRNIVWTISNLCRNKNPPPPFEAIKPCMPVLASLLHHEDEDILADSCWALSYLTDGSNDQIQAVLDGGVLPKIVQLLKFDQKINILTPALRTVGNIVTGNDSQTDSVIANEGLKYLSKLLTHSRNAIVKECAWAISNITAGNVEQIQKVIESGLVPQLLNVLHSGEFKSQKEAAWAFTNYTSGGSVEQIAYLIQSGLISPFTNLLDGRDVKTVLVVLDGLSNIFQTASKVGEIEKLGLLFEECGGLDKLELLQTHENESIYQKAADLVDMYFSMDPSEETCSFNPDVVNGQLNFKASDTPNSGFNF